MSKINNYQKLNTPQPPPSSNNQMKQVFATNFPPISNIQTEIPTTTTTTSITTTTTIPSISTSSLPHLNT